MAEQRSVRAAAALVACFALGVGVAACGGTQVSEKVPHSTPDLTVPTDQTPVAATPSTTSTTGTDTTASTAATAATPSTSSGTSGGTAAGGTAASGTQTPS